MSNSLNNKEDFNNINNGYSKGNSKDYSVQNRTRNNKELENNTDNISNISNNNSLITPNMFNQNANGNTTIDLNLNLSNQLRNNDSIISVR